MKAAQITKYGGPEVLQITEVETPVLKNGQVLIENYAAGINIFDITIRSGTMQKMVPLQLPVTIGGDFAGKITGLGEGVSDFAVGDEVYGQAIILTGASGSMAEQIASTTSHMARKPKNANFEEAGALPLVGVSALQALEDHMHLQKGQKILIHGGAGGIGHIAIQIAKAIGAYIATTVGNDDVDFVKGLGADEAIDYKTQKFEDLLKDFDGVFNTVRGGETEIKSYTVLKKGGVLVSMIGKPDEALATQYGVTAIGQQTKTDTSHLEKLAQYVDSGKVKVHIDKIFPLEKVVEAFTYQEQNHPKGKVVIKIKE